VQKISIVIRTKNEAAWLRQVLQAIARQTWTNYEVLIVDSGSTDQTLDIARDFGTQVLKVPPETFTYGRSLNVGVEAAKGEYIVALSGHAVPAVDTWLEALVTPLQDASVGGVYGRWEPLPDCNPFDILEIEQLFGKDRIIQTTDPKFSNANGAWRKAVWQVERFDESLPANEDQAWAAAVQKRSFSIVYEPTAVVLHSHNRNPGQLFRTGRAEVAAKKWIEKSDEEWRVITFLSVWLRSTWKGWQMTWRLRSNWRWWCYCPVYYLALRYGHYCGFRTPLHDVYPYGYHKRRPTTKQMMEDTNWEAYTTSRIGYGSVPDGMIR